MVEISVESKKSTKHSNVANNKCIQKLKVLFLLYNVNRIKVSFQSEKSHHRDSQISMSFRNPKSILHFVNIIVIPATSAFQCNRIYLLFFSALKQHFQFHANKMLCLETLQLVVKNCKRGICYCYFNFHFVKIKQKQSITFQLLASSINHQILFAEYL